MISCILLVLLGSYLYAEDMATIEHEWNQVHKNIAALCEPADKEILYNLYTCGLATPQLCHLQAIIDHMKLAVEKHKHMLDHNDQKTVAESLNILEDFVTNKAPRDEETLQQFFNNITITYIPRDLYISSLLRVDSNASIGGGLNGNRLYYLVRWINDSSS